MSSLRTPIPEIQWDNLVQHLKTLPPFLYLSNPGNAGDALIDLGFRHLMKQYQIEFREYSSENFFKSSRHLVFGGGGNLVPLYNDCSHLLSRHLEDVQSFTILPQTIAGHKDILAQLDSRFHLFCREPQSFEYARKLAGAGFQSYLSHDLALSLPHSGDFFKKHLLFPTLSIGRNIRWLKNARICQEYLSAGKTSFFRIDQESNSPVNREDNLDLSLALTTKMRHPAQRTAIAHNFLYYLKQAASIRTDRLHVAIAGCLLQKKVELHPNNYHKNSSIFYHSLQSQFPNCRFME